MLKKNTMKKLKYILLITFPLLTFAQTDIKKQIDSLIFSSEVPYTELQMYNKSSDSILYTRGCGDQYLWNVIKLKEKAIPYLIESIDNTKETPASFPYQGGQCTLGKMAFIALQEIIHGIPTAELLQVNPEDYDCGYCYYHITLDKRKNRKKFKKAIKEWYEKNKMNLVWVEADNFSTCESSSKHPNGGHYEVKNKI